MSGKAASMGSAMAGRALVLATALALAPAISGCSECRSTIDCPWGQICVSGSCEIRVPDADGDVTTDQTEVDTITDTTSDHPTDDGGEWVEDWSWPDEYVPDSVDDTSWPDEYVPDAVEDFPTDERMDEVIEDGPVYECWFDADCVDASDCTDDHCSPARVCLHVPAREGLECDDGLLCNGIETCRSGVCAADNAACEDYNPCTTDSCTEGPTPVCAHAEATDGTDCDNGLWCDGPDACQEGECVSGPQPCPRFHDNPCMHWVCQSASESCTEEPQPGGTTCSDGVDCNGLEVCDAGTCVPPDFAPCDDFNPCTIDSCSSSGGSVSCTNSSVSDGSACVTADPCAGTGRVCYGGACTAGAGASCWDGNLCTLDKCVDDGSGGASCTPLPGAVDTVECGTTLGIFSLSSAAEVSSYGSCGSGMTGPEVVLLFSAASAPANVRVALSGASTWGTITTLLLSDACTPASCYGSDTGLVADFALPGNDFYIVIDGYVDGGVTVTCP